MRLIPNKYFFILLHIITMPFQLAICLILLLYKLVVLLIAKVFCEFVDSIPGSTYAYLPDRIGVKPTLSIVVGIEFEQLLLKQNVMQCYDNVYNLRDKNGQRCYREFGYYPVIFMGHGFWKVIPNFHHGNHINFIKNESLENSDQIAKFVEKLQRKPFLKGEPLWSVHVIRNGTGGCYLFLRFHHMLGDGMSFIKFFYALTGCTELPVGYTRPSNSVKNWDRIGSNLFTKAGTALYTITVGVIDYVNEIIVEKDRNPINFALNGNVRHQGDWICSVGSPMDFEVLKNGARRLNCSVVHLVLAGLSTALEKYMIKYHDHEGPLPKHFNYIISYPMPNHPNLKLSNHWCLVKLRAKLGITDLSDKVQYYKQEVRRSATSSLPMVSAFALQYLCGLLPTILADYITKAKATSTVVLSNLAGPQNNQWKLGNSVIKDAFFWLPICQESMALAASVSSYNGILRLSLTADVGCIPSRRRLEFLQCLVRHEIMNMCAYTKQS